ncbi:MAG: glycosyltransferase family 2 protein [Pseudomonadota bacterium]
MTRLSVCILTFNSIRTLERCLLPAMTVADDLVVVDSGSTDGTLDFLATKGVLVHHNPYETHAVQMNLAISLAVNDWVLCLDSDEFLDSKTIDSINMLKAELVDPSVAWRITRHWHVLGREVRAIYPVSSPDNPVRLFNRTKVRFNNQPVDDKAEGFANSRIIPGHVIHDTFYSMHELFGKLNGYTSRLVKHRPIAPSLTRALLHPPFAFAKWYLRKGAWRDGAAGVVTAVYAASYTFLKYFKSWCREKQIP